MDSFEQAHADKEMLARFFQAMPKLEIRRTDYGHGVFVEDGTEPLFVSRLHGMTWNECGAFIVGFEKAWEVKK